eukprot:716952-Pelagomonas_calceolata.AAC.2
MSLFVGHLSKADSSCWNWIGAKLFNGLQWVLTCKQLTHGICAREGKQGPFAKRAAFRVAQICNAETSSVGIGDRFEGRGQSSLKPGNSKMD